MNHIVLDIETKNLFSDVGGKENLTKLSLSVAGVFSYTDNAFLTFSENEMPQFQNLLGKTDLIIGFNIDHFDLPVLQKYLSVDLSKIPTLDIMNEVVSKMGHRVSLDDLVSNTLGKRKSANGLIAVQYWREGRIDELKKYCLDDVRLTRDLYEHGLKNGEIKFTARDANLPYIKAIKVDWSKYADFQTEIASYKIQNLFG
ncbi:MAG: DEAD/DEAH box helicase domain protein [Candidatus Azambacteria bacterium GW2011_GWA2_39_10]|uniref:DEAD/DEAH box helicase domain protein n=1 Tax=Candidatus Azambacteria bacterium GW2011_GWA2_39_10 TaxID=1618611 RepID=A0A0G0PTV5_9BACT|nr:MAG: DEAD/DEAH box helicase domain protein [Candidatus Azambacteria bacterium GW2011_GWA2_39_10]